MVLEAILSAIALLGGGYLLTTPAADKFGSFVTAAMMMVLGFWFVRRQNDSSQSTVLSAIDTAATKAIAAVLQGQQTMAAPAPAPAPAPAETAPKVDAPK